jgi:hypothetical protein
MSPFPPPPPPTYQRTRAAVAARVQRDALRRGASGVESAPVLSEEDEFDRQRLERHERATALLDRLASTNFQLRQVLDEIRDKMQDGTGVGRRLFQRPVDTGTYALADSVKLTALSVGDGAVLGLTTAECSTLCAALKNASDTANSCAGVAYRVLDPSDPSNLHTAYCYLLRVRFPAFRICHTLQLHVPSPMALDTTVPAADAHTALYTCTRHLAMLVSIAVLPFARRTRARASPSTSQPGSSPGATRPAADRRP